MKMAIIAASLPIILLACSLSDDRPQGANYTVEVCSSLCPAPKTDSTKYDGLGEFTPDHTLIKCKQTTVAYECTNYPYP